jgi:hypothetical protein
MEDSKVPITKWLLATFHHSVSEAHLQRYATEGAFRWNHALLSASMTQPEPLLHSRRSVASD